jgi:hypothetical protein
VLPKTSKSKTSDIERKGITEISETDKERNLRLTSALRFAVEGQDFATAMRLTLEMTTDNPALPSIVRAGEEGATIKTEMQFLLRVMQLHYKPKKEFVHFHYKPKEEAVQSASIQSASRSILSLDE